jgi:uncharacterized protein (DUF983 family)
MPFLISLPWSRARNEKKKKNRSTHEHELVIERTILSMPHATAEGRCPRCGGEGIVPNSGRRFNPFLTRSSPGHVQCDDCGLEFDSGTNPQAEPRAPW